MDVLVMLEENPDHSPVLAHVNTVPSPLASAERPSRDVVTLYGAPSLESLALALAAAVECHRPGAVSLEAIRHLGVWPADHWHTINHRLVVELKNPTGDIAPYYERAVAQVLADTG